MKKEKIIKEKLIYLLKSLGIIFLFLFFSSIFFGIFNINPQKISDKKYIIYLTLSNTILFAIFVYIYRKTLLKDGKNFIKNFGDNIELSIKYWLIGFVIMVASNLFITFILNKSIAANEDQIRTYIDSIPLLMIIDTVILAPVMEELTFRKSIKDAISNKWVYVLTSGIIFGGLHILSSINSPIDLIYLIPYSALGISFALLYHRTDNIFSTISIHAMHNLLAVVVYLLGNLI